ncbi:plasmid SOS inhibition protein A [Serratia marcescens]|uniref:plasmid SOS inhibition protein A n=1 Tax=Serratia marcescens TaxID=615 RepID=UPI003204C42C
MIPNSHALTPNDEYQQAAVHAVVLVEQKKEQGKRLARFPYAKAFFRVLNNGRSQIRALDIRLLASNYSPEERDGSPIERYVEALDLLLESNGKYCPLPLPSDTAARLFPANAVRLRERDNRKWEMKFERQKRRHSREKQQKRRRYQNMLAQAEIELAFVTPSTVSSWYAHWSRKDIYEHDLSGSFDAWLERFPCFSRFEMRHCKGDALWSVVEYLGKVEAELTDAERIFNTLLLPNKLSYSEVHDYA